MENETIFLGQPVKYWVELQSKAEELGAVNWLREIATLRAKVSFYESRINEMISFNKELTK